MVLHKRLDYGFSGYQVPPTPRAARSARRRCSIRKTSDDKHLCAFDLLATVAGKLLLEGESCSSSSLNEKLHSSIVKSSIKKEDKPLKVEPRDQESSIRNSVVSEVVSQDPAINQSLKGFHSAQNDGCSGHVLAVTTSDCSDKVVSAEKLVQGKSGVEHGVFRNKVDVGSSGNSIESCDCTVEDDMKKERKSELPATSGTAKMSSSGDQVVLDSKSPALVSLDDSVKLSSCRDQNSFGSYPISRDDVKLVTKDDDENFFRCTHPSTTTRTSRPPPRIGDRRIRKLLASKYWKATPSLKEEEALGTDLEVKSVYRNRKSCFKRQRSQRDYPFKKRKLYDHSLVSNPDAGISSEGISSSTGKSFSEDTSGLGTTIQGAGGTSASVAGQRTSFPSRDSHVKLRIKSFKVPELFIEIPETATVGSLKRTVMEAVTTILGGGLRVGVLLQGKKIRDDSKTLQQSGISHDNKQDALGFTLEPNPSQSPPSLCPQDNPFLPSCDAPQPLTRYPHASNVVHEQGSSGVSLDPQLTNLGSAVESDHDSAPSPPDTPVDKSVTDSRALVTVPAMNAEALAVVPMRKSKRSEVAQRRIRRPFSVSEVEALVQAVEKLGTGRWRDVKLRAFDNAKHRTYVDLKDKWKTLVHTAKISPQQRRGEPVPQELLDRVLTAHAYWSHQQAKQQLKQQSETCLLL